MSKALRFIGSLTLLCLSVTTRAEPSTRAAFLNQVHATLQRAEASALGRLEDQTHWNMPLYMGTNYVSQYYLMRFWFAQNPNHNPQALIPFDESRLREILLQTQSADGSWQPTTDPSVASGSLDATIMNYWALKVMGVDSASASMMRARAFVLAHGGLEKASVFSRVFLALFAQLPWSSLPWTPLFLVNPNNPGFMNVERFPQWVRPHIVPIAYLSSVGVQRDLGPRFTLSELHAPHSQVPETNANTTSRAGYSGTVEQILSAQNPLGSWGGYTSATIFAAAALDDYQNMVGIEPRINAAIMRGLHFVDHMYIDPQNPSAYKGTVCDGRFWDTILILQGLLGFDPKFPQGDTVANFLEHAQTPEGGIPFGLDFEATPDVDDTAELVTTLQLKDPSQHVEAVHRAVQWLKEMQNSDGGWGAFDRNNTGNFVLRYFVGSLADSATLFDPSTPDITGHVLEALGAVGYTRKNSAAVRRAISYLNETVSPEGTWDGRWGVNYLYGTNAVVSGLLRVGVAASDPLIVNALAWIESHQNRDGGFGETTRSYLDLKEAGHGISTPSQTAWALMALVRAGRASGVAATRAVAYLLDTVSNEGLWQDPSVVGTGHPGIVYLVYPSYPVAFPMIALSGYLHSMNEVPAPLAN